MTALGSQERAFGTEFLDKILEWIDGNLEPDQVFSEAALESWAEDNGYVKKGDEQ